MNQPNLLSFSLKEKRAYFYCIAFLLFARFPLLNDLSYANDDLRVVGTITDEVEFIIGISQGRYIHGILDKILRLFSIPIQYLLGVSFLLGHSLLIFTGFVFIRLLSIKLKTFELTIFNLLMILHPYWIEASHFHISFLFISLSLAIPTFAIYQYQKLKTMRSAIYLIIFFFIFISIYQISINAVLVICILGIIWQLRDSQFISWKSATRFFYRNYLFRSIIFLVITSIIYKIIFEDINRSLEIGLQHHRGAFMDISQIKDRIMLMFSHYKRIFFTNEAIMNGYTKYLINIILVLFSLLLLSKLNRNSGDFKKLAVIISLLLGLILSLVGINTILVESVLAPRKLFSVSLFFSGVCLLTYAILGMELKNKNTKLLKQIKRLFSIICILILFIFYGINNKVLYEQVYIKRRDISLVTRIVSNLERHPEFSSQMPLAIVTNYFIDPHFFFPLNSSIYYDMGSVLSRPWSILPAFNFYSGYIFSHPNAEQMKLAQRHCEDTQNKRLPVIKKGTAIVCLKK